MLPLRAAEAEASVAAAVESVEPGRGPGSMWRCCRRESRLAMARWRAEWGTQCVEARGEEAAARGVSEDEEDEGATRAVEVEPSVRRAEGEDDCKPGVDLRGDDAMERGTIRKNSYRVPCTST